MRLRYTQRTRVCVQTFQNQTSSRDKGNMSLPGTPLETKWPMFWFKRTCFFVEFFAPQKKNRTFCHAFFLKKQEPKGPRDGSFKSFLTTKKNLYAFMGCKFPPPKMRKTRHQQDEMKLFFCGEVRGSLMILVLMADILHHPGCMKPC